MSGVRGRDVPDSVSCLAAIRQVLADIADVPTHVPTGPGRRDVGTGATWHVVPAPALRRSRSTRMLLEQGVD